MPQQTPQHMPSNPPVSYGYSQSGQNNREDVQQLEFSFRQQMMQLNSAAESDIGKHFGQLHAQPGMEPFSTIELFQLDGPTFPLEDHLNSLDGQSIERSKK